MFVINSVLSKSSCYSVEILLITVLQSGVSNVFQNSSGDVTAHLADIHLSTGVGDLVNTQLFR
jgi:pantoate kinase